MMTKCPRCSVPMLPEGAALLACHECKHTVTRESVGERKTHKLRPEHIFQGHIAGTRPPRRKKGL